MPAERSKKRFFSSEILSSRPKTILLDPDESHHLRHVLRLETRDHCLVFDREGNEWSGKVSGFSKSGQAEIELLNPMKRASASPIELVIAQAIPQRSKMDEIVEKAAELGVHQVVPLVTERTIVRIKKEDEAKVMARWSKIVQIAQKQCHSHVPTEVVKPVSFEKFLDSIEDRSLAFIFDPIAENGLRETLENLRQKIKNKTSVTITALIGPEGGFSEKEFKSAVSKGIQPVLLGETLLKTDTAFVTIASAFQYGVL